MPIMKVFRNANGSAINILPVGSDWNFEFESVPDTIVIIDPVTGAETSQQIFDAVPGGGYVPRTKIISRNPMPEGTTWADEEVTISSNGSVKAGS